MDLEYIEEQNETAETPPRNFATIGAVYADGVTLIFDGENAPSAKHYKCNTSVYFQAGDRVRIFEDSGTYVVEYVVGAPAQAPIVGIPAGGAKDQVLAKATATDYDAGWNTPHYVPKGGSNGQVLAKSSNTDYATGWVSVTGVPSGGSDGQALKKVSGSPAWANVNEVPSDGTTGYILKKTSGGWEWAAAPNGVQDDSSASTVIYFRSSGNDLQYKIGYGSWKTLATT